MEIITYEDVWNMITDALDSTGFTIFNVKKVCLPTNLYNVFKQKFVRGEILKWCGKPVVEVDAKVIYFIILEQSQ